LNRALEQTDLDPDRNVELLLGRRFSYKALLDDANAATDFQQVLLLVEARVDESSAEACYQLGVMYRTGRGTVKDSDKELLWITRAADKGHVQAQRVLGQYYFQKDHQDLRKSHSWMMKAATAGDTQAQRLLATRYATGRGLIQNADEAFKWYMLAAQEGDPVAQFEVAQSYRRGKPVEKDLQQAIIWLERSARQGYLPAEHLYGQLHASGEGTTKDLAEAIRWFWRAAEMGHTGARIKLGEQYLRGEGIKQNFPQALHWFSRSAGAPVAQYYLGEIYEKGLGVEANLKRAFSLYRNSAKERLPRSMVKTAMMYMSGTGVKEDQSVAANYIRFLGSGSPGVLNQAAWMLATDENPQLRSAELAQSFLRQAMKEDSSYQFIDTQAAVYAETGKFGKAVRSQKKALKEAGEEAEARSQMEQHLQAYQSKNPWRDTYQLPAGRSGQEPTQPQAEETVFLGSIILLREAKGFNRQGIVLNNRATYAMQILVQKVESGFLPHGQHEYLVVYLNNPADFYTETREAEGVLDYPLEPIRFYLKENPVGGWHYDFVMETLTGTTG
jgi:TPR repeat protein